EGDPGRYEAHIWDPRSGATSIEIIGKNLPGAASGVVTSRGQVIFNGGSPNGETWSWDARSGAVSKLPAPSRNGRSWRTLALRNGDALWMSGDTYEPKESPVQRWQADSQSWRALPMPLEDPRSHLLWDKMSELADGSLLLGNLRLAPGASTWTL